MAEMGHFPDTTYTEKTMPRTIGPRYLTSQSASDALIYLSH